jgi:hypothetical protein
LKALAKLLGASGVGFFGQNSKNISINRLQAVKNVLFIAAKLTLVVQAEGEGRHMGHHRLEEDKAERFVADWFEEHHEHEGAGYERGPWSRFMSCACSPEATHTVEIHNEAHDLAMVGHKAGSKVYVY